MIYIYTKNNKILQVERNDLTIAPTETHVRAFKDVFVTFKLSSLFKNEIALYVWEGEHELYTGLYLISDNSKREV